MKQKTFRKLLIGVAAVLVAAAGSLPFLLFAEEIRQMATLGYLGLFAACALTNASVFLPASGIAFTMAAAMVLDPLLCAVLGGLGTACGELVGYVLGRIGCRRVEDLHQLEKARVWLRRYGYLSIFAFAALPLPLFDVIGITAGTARLHPVKFFAVCTAGKIIKMLVYVFIVSNFAFLRGYF